MNAKRILSMLLAGLMVAGMSVSSFANGTDTKTDDSTPPAQETPNEAPEGDYSVMPLGTPDGTAPVLKSVVIDTTEVSAGRTVTLTIDAEDDISGISYIYAYFENAESGRTIYEGIDVTELTSPYQITFEISENEPSGTFYLDQLTLRDNSGSNGNLSGNEVTYYSTNNESQSNYLPSEITFDVTNEIEQEDNVPPTLKSVSITETEVSAGGTFTLTVDAEDDVSGVRYIFAYFRNDENSRTLSEGINVTELTSPYQITFEISENEPSGTFYLDQIALRDNSGTQGNLSGNEVTYFSQNNENKINYLPSEITLNVTNVVEQEDSLPPVLKSISINKTEVEVPGTVVLKVDATDNLSGVNYVWARFTNYENGRDIYQGIDVTDMEAPFSLEFNISEHEPSGMFNLDQVHLIDNSGKDSNLDGNEIRYYSNKSSFVENYLPTELSFFVHNSDEESDGDVVASTMTANLADKVNQMENGNTAYIYYGNDATLDEEVFDAVAGTDKKLVLSSDGIQWEFDGKTVDADKAKDLELDVDIERDRRSDSENADEIEEALGTKNSIIVSFPENGELPGPAKIRIKMDHVFRDYIDYKDGEATVYVYYYDNTTGEFVEVASNLAVGTDEYLEFTITHNSDFVIMNGAYVKPEDKPEDDTNDKPTWTPSYDDDEDEDVVVLEDDKEKITVEEFANGTVKANRKSASKGQKVTLTVTPDDGYVLKSLTVTNSKGKEVEVTEKNGKYYFEMPSTKVSIDAEGVKASVASVEKTNPETGAGDVANVSVAFAVCSVMCGAVLVSKKR